MVGKRVLMQRLKCACAVMTSRPSRVFLRNRVSLADVMSVMDRQTKIKVHVLTANYIQGCPPLDWRVVNTSGPEATS